MKMTTKPSIRDSNKTKRKKNPDTFSHGQSRFETDSLGEVKVGADGMWGTARDIRAFFGAKG
jgi:hypothetical protein